MENRVPRYPGRVTLTPVAGQANTYDLVRADQPTQVGTPLNKETLFSDATAAKYPGGVDTPDKALEVLGNYNLYWWIRRTAVLGVTYGKLESITILQSKTSSSTSLCYYSNSVSNDGVSLSLDNPILLEFSYSTYKNASVLVGKYFKMYSGDTIYYVDKNSAGPTNPSDAYYNYVEIDAKQAFGGYIYGEEEYIQSANKNEYPHFGIANGYEYLYCGKPLENGIRSVRIETGSYIGTGTYGASNPNTLTLGFRPKYVFLARAAQSYNSKACTSFIFFAYPMQYPCVNADSSNAFGASMTVKWNEKDISFYSTYSSESQGNESGITYQYVAIG